MTAPQQLYDDGMIQVDREAVTLRRYHFPSGTSKIIPVRAISGFTVTPLDWMHRYRLWGSSDLRRWLPLDVRRLRKTTLVTLDVDGNRWRPAFTPEHPDQFVEVLDELLGN